MPLLSVHLHRLSRIEPLVGSVQQPLVDYSLSNFGSADCIDSVWL